MLLLALDTTTRAGSVAVTRDDAVLALVEGDASRTHGERLPAELERVLDMAAVRLQDLDLLVVSSGPGAFTGLRIGLAAMQGLAMVLHKPVIGVSALEALADVARSELAVPQHTGVATWMDAQRGEVFAAAYDMRNGNAICEVLPPIVGTPPAMLDALPFSPAQELVFIGDGALRYAAVIEDARVGFARVIDPLPPIAAALGRLGRRRAALGEAGPPHALQPLYVRRPDAELDRERQAGS